MIISQTPLRMSFVGGGSDLPSFYQKYGGAVISSTINKYIYINVNKKFDDQIRVSYSITEFADSPEELKHELVKTTLKLLGIHKGIEITSISDIPSQGTGLGSSSSYTVGLLNALNAYLEKFSSKEYLGSQACHVEIDLCGKPIGKQDQYAAAYGGLNLIEFNKDNTVTISPVICKNETKMKLQQNLLMLYTGLTRSAGTVLQQQKDNTENDVQVISTLKAMTALAYELRNSLSRDDLNGFGEILDTNWELKQKLSEQISTGQINQWYKLAKKNGAIGGKILGAGGGGFLLLYAPQSKHGKIIKCLPDLRPIEFSFESAGSKIIYYQ